MTDQTAKSKRTTLNCESGSQLDCNDLFIGIRVFPRKTKWTPTDPLAFVGEPPLPMFRPADPKTPVRVSVTFTWDRELGERAQRSWARFYQDVQIGGPAYGDPGGEFTPGQYLKQGVTITSRGCPQRCPWCVVPEREGKIRELTVKPGWIVQDNNLLACSEGHIRAVFDMLRRQPKGASFNGGLDASFLRPWHRELIDSIRLSELWFACDTPSGMRALETAAKILDGVPIGKRRCYVMLGYNGETIGDAEQRCQRVYDAGYLPFAQLYRADRQAPWPDDWRQLARKWSRPAAYRSGR